MNSDRVNDTLRPGIWMTLYDLYLRTARTLLLDVREVVKEIQVQRSALESDGHDEGYIHHLLRVKEEHLIVLSTSAQMYSCMAVEAFLNFYGVRRLGEKFYKRNYERLTITQKAAALLATCQGILITPDAEIVTTLQTLFDQRNRLVHPKTKDLTQSDTSHLVRILAQLSDPVQDAERCVAGALRVFEILIDYDPDLEGLIVDLTAENQPSTS